MVQVFFKDARGQVINVITDISELATALNDQSILSETSIMGLLDYLLRNHFHTTIGGTPYYQSKFSVGIGKPVTIVYTELSQPRPDARYRVTLKDRTGNVISDELKDNVGISEMLNDPTILNISGEAQLELYLISHHYMTQINGIPYMHTNYSVGVDLVSTFVFEEC